MLLREIKGGLHLARGINKHYDSSFEQLHSDTLKSAIFACAIQLYPELQSPTSGKNFLNSFKISSAYPFYESKQKSSSPFYFFPKPELANLNLQIVDNNNNLLTGLRKQLKKVRYIDQLLFSRLLKAKQNITIYDDNIVDNFMVSNLQDNTFKSILEVDKCQKILSNKPYQHVAIDPSNPQKTTTPYYVDKFFFHKNSGLYFLFESTNNKIEEQVIAALRLLADNGIGMDRNTGNGQFLFDPNICVKSIELDIPNNANYEMNLSLYCPLKQEIESTLHDSYFSIIKRGGYISSPQDFQHLTIRKRSIYMFKEGSIFPRTEKPRIGKTVDLKPNNDLLKNNKVNHPIWRDGQAIFIPIVLKQ